MLTTTIPNPTDRLVYTVAEAAHALRIGRSKLYELLASGEIESIHIGRSRKIPAPALHDYITRLREQEVPHEQTPTQRTHEDLPRL